MAIEHLPESGRAVIEAVSVEVEANVSSSQRVVLGAHLGDASEATTYFRLSPTRIVLPAITEPLWIVVSSPEGEFPPGTQLSLSFSSTVSGRTSQLFGPTFDVSALDSAQLAEVAPHGDQAVRVQLLKLDHATIDPRLTELSMAAVRSARRMQRQGRIDRSPRGLAVCVDTSASMLEHRRSGLMQVLIEVCLGIDRGWGDGGDVPVFGVNRFVTALPPATSENASDYVDEVLGTATATTGLRASTIASTPGLDDHDRTIVVLTDGLPPDVAAAAEQWAGREHARWRLIIVGNRSADSRAATFAGAFVNPGANRDELTVGDGARAAMDRLVVDLIGAGRPEGTQ